MLIESRAAQEPPKKKWSASFSFRPAFVLVFSLQQQQQQQPLNYTSRRSTNFN